MRKNEQYTMEEALEEPSEAGAAESTVQTSENINISGFLETNQVKMNTTGRTLDSISTGRLSIWKVFSSHITLLGTDEPISYYVESRDYTYTTAHNTPLQYAVSCGLICAIFYVLFNILAGLKSISVALKEEADDYELMPIAFTMVFIVVSMLATINTPFLYMLATYYFVVQMPVMIGTVNEKGKIKIRKTESDLR